MTKYIMDDVRVEFNREERKVIFYDKDDLPISVLEDLKLDTWLYLGKFFIDFALNLYVKEIKDGRIRMEEHS